MLPKRENRWLNFVKRDSVLKFSQLLLAQFSQLVTLALFQKRNAAASPVSFRGCICTFVHEHFKNRFSYTCIHIHKARIYFRILARARPPHPDFSPAIILGQFKKKEGPPLWKIAFLRSFALANYYVKLWTGNLNLPKKLEDIYV